ncbi:MAG: endo-1,4-beta-xylanase [Lachnospiraceae bacterium]|nr:endo-1,4-beta-xylanase [Lachnospiraceae bacterium]
MNKQHFKWIAILALVMNVLLCMVAGPGFISYAKTQYVDTSDYPELDELYSDYFRIGVAVQAIDHWNDPTAEIGNPDKEDLIDRCFNSMTFGNEFKPAYNFDSGSPTLFTVDPAAEELLVWAKEHNMPVRGHTLVWHSQVDPSIFAKDYKAYSGGKLTTYWDDKLDEDCLVDRDELIGRLKTYIYGVIEYTYKNGFGDVIYAWDVVNEATDENQPDGLRESYWKKIIGPEYLYYSFLFAREACVKYSGEYADLYDSVTTPKLYYNDYNEWYPKRVDIITRFISQDKFNENDSLIKSNVINDSGDGTILGDGLIDGIGMQGHLDSSQNIDTYIDALKAYDACTGDVQITELDVGINGSGDKAYYKQAEFYYDFFDALKKSVDEGVNLNSVTFWGLTDDASWRKGADPLLFNGDLSNKPCFDALIMAGEGTGFTLQDESSDTKAKDQTIDFEPTVSDSGTRLALPAVLGFKSRGTGHQSKVMLVSTDNHTEGADPGYCLKISREEQDAGVKYDASGYAGSCIEVKMYIKTEDTVIRLGMESENTNVIKTIQADGDWTCAEAMFDVPQNADFANVYVETDASADILLDDLTISLSDPASYEDYVKKNAGSYEGLKEEPDITKEDEQSVTQTPVKPWDSFKQWLLNLFKA